MPGVCVWPGLTALLDTNPDFNVRIKYHKKYGDACLTSISVLFFTTPDIVNVELYNLVEVEGVEPSSEHIVIQLSPSADSILCFAPTPPADRLRHR